MLKPGEINEVAHDFGEEVARRDYVRRIFAPTFADDPVAWAMVVEVMEIILHRRDLYIVPAARIRDVE
jgi:hypothetical protein